MTDLLAQLTLDPIEPKTWEPLLRHAAAETAAQLMELAPHDPAFVQWVISLYVFKALKSTVDAVDMASEAIGEERALDALLAENPSCRKTFGDFEVFRSTLVETERRSALERLLKKITSSPLIQ